MDRRPAPLLSRLLSWKYGTAVAVLILVITLNSTLLFFSQLLQQSNAKFYHHGEGKSYMSINVAGENHDESHNTDGKSLSPSTLLNSAVGSLASYIDNISGKSQEQILVAPAIDIVYTWVNGSDPRQMQALLKVKLEKMTQENGTLMRLCNETETTKEHGCYKDEETASRFQDNEELRYSLRSVWKYAPWVRNIYLVTNGQIPSWLNIQHPRIHIVPHTSIFANSSHLPTFSSPAIEANLHRIPGLSEHFLYLNDDVMFGREVSPADFYSYGNGQRVYFAWAVPDCANGCSHEWVGDGYCDTACNVSACRFDLGDCDNVTETSTNSYTNSWSWNPSPSDSTTPCTPGCLDSWIGDKYCDRACKNSECGFDAGDCGIDLVYELVPGLTLTPSHVLMHVPTGLSPPLETLKIPTIEIGDVSRGHHLAYSSVLYFNASKILQGAIIMESSYSNPALLRTVVVSPKHSVIIVYFKPIARTAGLPVDAPTHSPSSNTTSTASPDTNLDKDKDSKSSPSNSTSTTGPSALGGGKIFFTFSARDIFSNEVRDFMFYVQLYQPSPPAAPVVQTPPDTASTGPSNAGQTRTLLWSEWTKLANSVIEEDEDEGEQVASRMAMVDGDKTAFWARPNPKLEEKTARRALRLGITQKEIDVEMNLIRRSGREGVDYLQQLGNVWGSSSSKMPKRMLSPLLKKDTKIEEETRIVGAGTRKLLDYYGDSLIHVSLLLSEAFAPEVRKVPAHMPHFLQKSIIQRMQTLWRREFEATSSHRTRAGDDMQYAFSYFWFLMRERVPYNFTDVWENVLDTNSDNVLDANELRTVASVITRSEVAYIKPSSKDVFATWNAWASSHDKEPGEEPVFEWLRDCNQIWLDWMPELANVPAPVDVPVTITEQVVQDSKSALLAMEKKAGNPIPAPKAPTTTQHQPQYYENLVDRLVNVFNVTIFPSNWTLTKEQLMNCSAAFSPLERHYKARLRNKFELGDRDEVGFVMVPANRTKAVKGMDDIRSSRPKFICLNDNINHTSPHAVPVLHALQEFYKALFPQPSPFELPHGQRNKFLHTEDLLAFRSTIQRKKTQLYLLIGFVLFLLSIAIYILTRKRNKSTHTDTRGTSSSSRIFGSSGASTRPSHRLSARSEDV